MRAGGGGLSSRTVAAGVSVSETFARWVAKRAKAVLCFGEFKEARKTEAGPSEEGN